jgi:hypothetical protein
MTAVLVPDVNHRLLPGKSRTPLDPQVINVHTMVWDIENCERYFARAGNPYSHFGTGHDGEVRQWQDLRYRAASCLDGNPYNISIENADKGAGFPAWTGVNVPAFTDAQADSLVVLLSWLCHRFGLPKSAIATSRPHERGIGWHRLGVDPYRHPSGRRWSSARGKVCPGDRRIHQLTTEIIPAVSAPSPAPDQGDDDMGGWTALIQAAFDAKHPNGLDAENKAKVWFWGDVVTRKAVVGDDPWGAYLWIKANESALQ